MFVYGYALHFAGRDLWRGVAYNAPIGFIFLVLAWDLAFRVVTSHGLQDVFKRYGVILAVWMAGFVVLYFRLVERSITVSGHMTWVVLMLVHCYVLAVPRSFTLLAGAVLAEAAYFNLVLFKGHSGRNGLVVGAVLGMVLAVAAPRRPAPALAA